jgi:hypothetical protein
VSDPNFPPELDALLHDPSVVMPGEHELLEQIRAWTTAPSLTPSAGGVARFTLMADQFVWHRAGEPAEGSTTPAAV